MRAGGLTIAALILSAGPLRADEPLHIAGTGPLAVAQIETLSLDDADRRIDLRLVFPETGGPYPLIVFSHGTFSSKDMYAPVVEHWASHGYVVILPNHVDANRGVMPQGESGMRDIIMSRAADLSRVLDRLDDIEAAAPTLKGKIDRSHFIAAGHSVGSYVAMLASGLEMRNPSDGEIDRHAETRFEAVVMLSDPGKMALQPDDLWKGSLVPTFLATGSDDYGLMGKGNRPTTYTMERLTGDDVPAGSRYFLLINKGDHYFGGLIHRAVADATPDHEGLAIFNEASTAFLNWVSKKDEDAHDLLTKADWSTLTQGRAVLSVE